MADLARIARRVRELPPRVVAQKAWLRVRDTVGDALERSRDRRRSTYDAKGPSAPLEARLGGLRDLGVTPEAARACAHYLEHRFDLLGSGWTSVAYGAKVPGAFGQRYDGAPRIAGPHDLALLDLLPPAARGEAARIRDLVSDDFTPIDWQRDLKSGWRWSESTWYGDILTEGIPGADIKCVWELARCHHLPQLAILARALGTDGPLAQRCSREFQDTVLDFVSANPPRFGANWVTAMDVAIRIANMVVAYDLFEQTGVEFEPAFEEVFARSVQEHARFIADHLERTPWLRGNHYFADVTGLLFAATYLPRSGEADRWLRLAAAEFLAAVEEQFGDDGAGFEASTAYHGLTGQMAVWGTALLLALADDGRTAPLVPDAPEWLSERLARIGDFTRDATAPDGRIVQIGDNDSGRFIKPAPVFDDIEGRLVEVSTEHGYVPAGIDALLGASTHAGVSESHATEVALVEALTGGRILAPAAATSVPAIHLASERSVPDPTASAVPWEFPAPVGIAGNLRAGLQTVAYPDFGLYVWRSARLFLAVRCGSLGQSGNGGHAHNDQLSIELWLDGKPVVRDPGTGVYTPSKETRDAYRSVGAHFAPRIPDREPGCLDTIFQITRSSPGVCVRFDADGFLGYHDGFGVRVWRAVEIDDSGVRGRDWAENGAELVIRDAPQPYSSGYGHVKVD